ncbi:MAG: BlaI/MecI/CopY family transcriptional regulator [Oscillospiraceae bacterium]|nr:BlaI/MecI/CopY family transcriptional regulator [Oscillospiraceae bacterium]
MEFTKMGQVESRFADLIWDNEPLTSKELVELCNRELQWKKSTTYTVLKKLCEKGLFQNDGGTVTSLVSREEYHAGQGVQMVEEAFNGSLPSFVAAFMNRQKISAEEIERIQKLIDSYKEEE